MHSKVASVYEPCAAALKSARQESGTKEANSTQFTRSFVNGRAAAWPTSAAHSNEHDYERHIM
jgi:hypothetical protein